MTSKRVHVDAHDMGLRRSAGENHVVLFIAGPRGSLSKSACLSIDEARNLRDRLIDAIGKLEFWEGDR